MVSGSLGSSSASVREPQRPTESLRGNRAMGQRVIHRAVPTSMLSDQRQLDQRTERAIRAQDRVGELERRARPRGVGPVELPPEPVEFAWPQPGVPRGGARPIRHTLINAATAFVFDVLWKEPKRIKRWPHNVRNDTPSELHQLVDDSARSKIKLRTRARPGSPRPRGHPAGPFKNGPGVHPSGQLLPPSNPSTASWLVDRPPLGCENVTKR
jgi:hypothetical protein